VTIVLLGLPYDASSSFLRGAAQAPPAIRAALRSDSTNLWNEDVRDVGPLLADLGDLSFEGAADARAVIEGQAAAHLAQGRRAIFLGGDHSITWPLMRAVRRHVGGVTILHLDAHPDLYETFQGDRYSHACPFARIMEQGLAERLLQMGIRCLNGHQEAQARRFGVEVVTMRRGMEEMLRQVSGLEGPTYLSLDLDVLDPGFAPGVSHPEPGGLTTRELVGLIQAIPAGALVAADVVEMNPVNDVRDLTARVAAKLVKEIAGRMAGP